MSEKNMPSRSLDESVFKNGELVQSYLNWLDVRYPAWFVTYPGFNVCIIDQSFSLFHSFSASLQDEKGLNPGTISNHISAILYVLKFLNKESAPKYDGVALITQLRSVATELQKEGKEIYMTRKES